MSTQTDFKIREAYRDRQLFVTKKFLNYCSIESGRTSPFHIFLDIFLMHRIAFGFFNFITDKAPTTNPKVLSILDISLLILLLF